MTLENEFTMIFIFGGIIDFKNTNKNEKKTFKNSTRP